MWLPPDPQLPCALLESTFYHTNLIGRWQSLSGWHGPNTSAHEMRCAGWNRARCCYSMLLFGGSLRAQVPCPYCEAPSQKCGCEKLRNPNSPSTLWLAGRRAGTMAVQAAMRRSMKSSLPSFTPPASPFLCTHTHTHTRARVFVWHSVGWFLPAMLTSNPSLYLYPNHAQCRHLYLLPGTWTCTISKHWIGTAAGVASPWPPTAVCFVGVDALPRKHHWVVAESFRVACRK